MRRKMKRSKDKKIFSRTATRTRKINVDPSYFRGGIRM